MSPLFVTCASPANDNAATPLAAPADTTSIPPLLSMLESPSADVTIPYAP